MAQPKSVVGMDVHATQTHVSVLDPRSGELRSRRLSGPPRGALDFLAELPAPVLAVYEAGPTGYGLARGAAERGLDVRICAPGSIPRAPGDRVKTDRRDAERLARLLLAGELSFVRVPTPEEEHFRDLTRCREAIRADLMRARHRVTKFLLRRELRWEGSACAWTQAHWKWLDGIEFSDGPSSAVLADYLCAVRALEQRRGVAERAIEEGWPESPWAETVARLRCLRGIDTLSALGICAEAGDLRRFGRPASLMSYFGIVPSEYSSGEQRRRGPITKAWLPPRPPPAGGGGSALPPPAQGCRPLGASSAGSGPPRRADRLARSAPPARAMGAPAGGAGKARQCGQDRAGARARLLRVGGGSAELNRRRDRSAPDAVGAPREKSRPARRSSWACVASWGSRRIFRPAVPVSRLQATRRIGGHGVASPRI